MNYNLSYYPIFKYVDVGKTKKGRWKRIEVSQISEEQKKRGNVDFCISVARYKEIDPQKDQPLLQGLVFDLDGEKALEDAIKLRNLFFQKWKLKEGEVRFYFSGNRGFHITISPEALNLHPSIDLHLRLKHVAKIIEDELELSSLDRVMYAKRHLIRCPDTKHSKTELYKVELHHYELDYSLEKIKELAKEARGTLVVKEHLLINRNEDALAIFNSYFDIAVAITKEQVYRDDSTTYLATIRGIKHAPACVLDLLDNNIRVKGTRNRATLVLITYFRDNGKSKKEIISLLTPWARKMSPNLTSANENERVQHVKEVCNFVFSPSGNDYHFNCAFILSLGSKDKPITCKTRCQLKLSQREVSKLNKAEETKIIPASFLELEDRRIAEAIFDPETKKGSFAIYNHLDGRVIYQDEITTDYLIKYVPLIDENVLRKCVLLPSKAEEYGSEDILIKEIQDFTAEFYHEHRKIFCTINICYIFFTWLYDRFRTWCYLQWLGRAGGGKSRGLEVIGYLCYKPIILGGGDSPASMFRMLDRFKGTALIDEATFTKNSESHNAITQILNVGYKKGGSVGRCEGENNFPVRYTVAGPKLLATRIDFVDDGLRSRCIVRRTGKDHRIREGDNKQPFTLPDDFEHRALHIRNKLLMWRFHKWYEAQLKPELEIKEVESRLNEILVPILSVMETESILTDIKELAEEQQEDLKEQRRSSLEGEILLALKQIGLSNEDIPSSKIGDKVNESRSSIVNAKTISTHRVTKVLKGLELEVKKIANRYNLLVTEDNKNLLKELFHDYNISDENN